MKNEATFEALNQPPPRAPEGGRSMVVRGMYRAFTAMIIFLVLGLWMFEQPARLFHVIWFAIAIPVVIGFVLLWRRLGRFFTDGRAVAGTIVTCDVHPFSHNVYRVAFEMDGAPRKVLFGTVGIGPVPIGNEVRVLLLDDERVAVAVGGGLFQGRQI